MKREAAAGPRCTRKEGMASRAEVIPTIQGPHPDWVKKAGTWTVIDRTPTAGHVFSSYIIPL